MVGDLIGKFLEVTGFKVRSWDKQALSALLDLTGEETFDVSPMHAARTSAWAISALDRISPESKRNLARAVGINSLVAAAVADKILAKTYNLQLSARSADAQQQELIILSQANQLIESLNIPVEVYRIPFWQNNLVDKMKKRYKEKDFEMERRWSTGSNLVVAVKLLEIANPVK